MAEHERAAEGKDTRPGRTGAPGSPADGGGAGTSAGTEAAGRGGGSGATPSGAGPTTAATGPRGADVRPSRLGWVGLTVTAVLLVWQVIYAVNVVGPGLDGGEVYTSVWLLISLVLAVGAVVLGIVAASQRVSPRWPATAALAVGTYVFLVCIATWAGSLMGSTP